MTTITFFTHEFILKVRLEWTGKWSICAFTNLQSSIAVQHNFDVCLIGMVSQLVTKLNRERVWHLGVIKHWNWLLNRRKKKQRKKRHLGRKVIGECLSEWKLVHLPNWTTQSSGRFSDDIIVCVCRINIRDFLAKKSIPTITWLQQN